MRTARLIAGLKSRATHDFQSIPVRARVAVLTTIATVAVATLSAQPTFRSAVNLVTVQVAVSAKDGSRIGELGVGDFRVYEDDVLQEVAAVTHEPRSLSICILLDSSPSMAGREAVATRAIDTLLTRLNEDDEVAMLMFASRVRVALPWTRARDTRSFSWYGWRLALGTALLDAMKEALTLVESAHNALPVIVVVSDGEDNVSGTTLGALALTRRQSETMVYGIHIERPPSTSRAIGRPRPNDLLPAVVGAGGTVLRAVDEAAAEQAATALLEDLRSQYTVGFAPKKAMDDRYRRIRIEMTNPSLNPRHRDGYLAQSNRK